MLSNEDSHSITQGPSLGELLAPFPKIRALLAAAEKYFGSDWEAVSAKLLGAVELVKENVAKKAVSE